MTVLICVDTRIAVSGSCGIAILRAIDSYDSRYDSSVAINARLQTLAIN